MCGEEDEYVALDGMRRVSIGVEVQWVPGSQPDRWRHQYELKTKKGRGKITQNVKQICPCERGAREDDGKMLCHSTRVVRKDMPCEKYSAEKRKGREVSS